MSLSSPWSWVQSLPEITYEIVSPPLNPYQHGLALKNHICFSLIPRWLWLILERNCICGQPSASIAIATTSLGPHISKFLLDASPILFILWSVQGGRTLLTSELCRPKSYSGCIKWEMTGGWKISNELIPHLQLLSAISTILFLQKRNPAFFKLFMWTPACGWI